MFGNGWTQSLEISLADFLTIPLPGLRSREQFAFGTVYAPSGSLGVGRWGYGK
jgi:hypothetical protein